MKSDGDTCVFRWRFVNCHTFLIFCGLVVGWLLALPCNASAQMQFTPDVAAADSEEPAAEDPAARPRGQQSSEMVDQINSIRRQMGGGVASQLEGLFGDSEEGRRHLQRAFDKGLNELVATPRPAPPAELASLDVSIDRVSAALRKAARELDLAAADLEDAGLYSEADMIRASAGNLRSRARAVAPSWAARSAQLEGAAAPRLPSLGRSGVTPGNSGLPTEWLSPKIRPRQ